MRNIINAPALVRSVQDEDARRINAAHRQGEALHRQCGLWLIDKQKALGHGEWERWATENLEFSLRTARRYMAVAANKSASLSDLLDNELDELDAPPEHHQADEEPSEAGQPEPLEGEAEGTHKPHNWVDKECQDTDWYTPETILQAVRHYFGGPIPLDPATAAHNPTQAIRFFTQADDGLAQDWRGPGVFVNPPYGDLLPRWCVKISYEAAAGTPLIALLPCGARFGTGYWQDHILSSRLNAICFVRGRVAFIDRDGNPQPSNPYDSALYGYNVMEGKFLESFSELGRVLLVKVAHE